LFEISRGEEWHSLEQQLEGGEEKQAGWVQKNMVSLGVLMVGIIVLSGSVKVSGGKVLFYGSSKKLN
jgi:hypothetical protein